MNILLQERTTIAKLAGPKGIYPCQNADLSQVNR